MKTAIIIPARLQSTRLPRKLLLDKTGKSLLQHTYEAAQQSKLTSEVIVAADDEEIVRCVEDFGGKVVLTSPAHESGTSRIAEVAQNLTGFDFIVNVQGDEPELAGDSIDAAIRVLADSDSAVSTLATPLRERTALNDPSVVKVVFDGNQDALYFSRSPIPCARDWNDGLLSGSPDVYFQHIGLYAFRTEFLLQWTSLPACQLERVESLEQLRILHAGFKIRVGVVDHHATGIDTPEDYQAFVRRLAN